MSQYVRPNVAPVITYRIAVTTSATAAAAINHGNSGKTKIVMVASVDSFVAFGSSATAVGTVDNTDWPLYAKQPVEFEIDKPTFFCGALGTGSGTIYYYFPGQTA